MSIRFCTAAGLAIAMACAASATTFQYDNGTTNVAVGPPNSFPVDPVTGWGNYYETPAGGSIITQISCAFGPNANPVTPVTLSLFADPDHDFDPRNALLLTQVIGVPTQIGMSYFTTFDIPDTYVDGGFFIMASCYTKKGTDKPAAGDTSARTDRSWYFYNPATSGMNFANLGANALANRVTAVLPFPCAWMLRAEGVAPAPGAAGLLGVAGLAGLRRRRA